MPTKRRTGYLFKRGENWYVRYKVNGEPFTKRLSDENGQPIKQKREAELARDLFMAPIAVGDEATVFEGMAHKLDTTRDRLADIVADKAKPLAIAAAWKAFIEAPNRPDPNQSTLGQYECQFEAFADWMSDRHKDRPALVDVDRTTATEYAKHLSTLKLSPNTYNKHLNTLALVWRVLQHEAKLTGNIWATPENGGFLERKTLTPNSRRELSIEELRTACEKAEGELRTLIALGVYTGMRLADCATLRKHDVDLVQQQIKRVPNKTRRTKPGLSVTVPIHPSLLPMLVEAMNASATDYVLPNTAASYIQRRDNVTDAIQRHFKSCGITLYKEGTGKDGVRAVVEVGFHSLRHTFVSMCRRSGAPLMFVEKLVGHSNPAMTRHYSHSDNATANQAVAALPNVV